MSRRGVELGWLSDRLPVVVGTLVGITTGYILSRGKYGAVPIADRRSLANLERMVADLLASDPILGSRPIEVGALTAGIIELTGPVRDEWEADRAVTLSRQVVGVETVLNRLDQEIVEDHITRTLDRFDAGDPSLESTGWQGVGVGTGRRRQSLETDPERPSDRVKLVTRALGVDRAVEETSERLDKLPTGGEGHTSAPAAPIDRGLVEDASHRRLGNEPVEPLQDLNPEGQILDGIELGTEVTLEESGLEAELHEEGEDRT